jgi:hypothetical protein
MVIKPCKELLTKDGQTTNIKTFWLCEKDDIHDENFQNNKVT